MNEKRFTVKPQDNYFGVTDNLTEDKVNVVNGIRTEIEAKWLCDLLNGFSDEIIEREKEILHWKQVVRVLKDEILDLRDRLFEPDCDTENEG